MKNCPTCGKRNWEDALDCHSCGASLHDMEYQDCLFEYYRKCADDGSDALAKIMLTESANLGSKDATKEMRKLGLEIRPLIRYERKIVKSLKNEIYEYSGVDMNSPKPKRKDEQVTTDIEETPERETPLLDGIFGIIEWSFENPFNMMVSTFAFVALLSVSTTLMFGPPENGGWPESDTPSTYSAKRYLKDSLKDPGSYDSISWGDVRESGDGRYTVTHTYRAKNSFGGYVVDSATFILDNDGNVIYMQDN